MNQGIHLNREIPEDEFVNLIDFGRERWGEGMDAWLDRRYRVLPMDGYDTRYPRIDRFPDNINTKNPVFQRN